MVIDEIQIQTRKEKISTWYTDIFPLVATYVSKKGGNLEEAKEIFQEAIFLYYEKLTISNFSPEQSDEAYLIGIAKKKWLKHCSSRKYHESLNNVDLPEVIEQKPKTQYLMLHLKLTGKRCLDILQAFYYEKLNMCQLADRFGYTSERSVTVQKYKCLEKVRDEVKRKSLSYEDFLK